MLPPPLLDSPVFDLLAQAGTASGVQKAAAGGIAIAVVLAAVFFGLAVYLFFCFCLKKICEKAGHEPGVLIWIPILNLIPQLTVAKLPIWTIVLFFIPLVNLGIIIYMWIKICEARGKPGPLGILIIVPLANLGLICWLAFAD